MSRKNYEAIADVLSDEVNIHERVRVFNKLVPILKADNPNFKPFVFYERMFKNKNELAYLSWPGGLATVEIKERGWVEI